MAVMQIKSAGEIQSAINRRLEAAGLGPSYRVGMPVRLPYAEQGAPNWHFLDMLSGDIEDMSVATKILADARHQYNLADAD